MKRRYLIPLVLILALCSCAGSWQRNIQAGLTTAQITVSTMQPALEIAHEQGVITGEKWNRIATVNNAIACPVQRDNGKCISRFDQAWRLYWLYEKYSQPEVKEKLASSLTEILELVAELQALVAEFGIEVE